MKSKKALLMVMAMAVVFGLTGCGHSSVASIGYYAFYGCSNLKSLNYSGTKAQWSAITLNDALNNSSVATVVCSDGTITL